jgi:hypothetical protein
VEFDFEKLGDVVLFVEADFELELPSFPLNSCANLSFAS